MSWLKRELDNFSQSVKDLGDRLDPSKPSTTEKVKQTGETIKEVKKVIIDTINPFS